MKKIFVVFAVFFVILNSNVIFAQEEDDARPYLTDEDMESLDIVLPFDEPEYSGENPQTVAEAPEAPVEENESTEADETGPDTQRAVYHLLILDRIYSPLDSDIDGEGKISVLYNFKHGADGYLITIYKSLEEGPAFPVLPAKSYILVNLATIQKSMIQDYVNSGAFKRLVTHRTVLSDLKSLFETDW